MHHDDYNTHVHRPFKYSEEVRPRKETINTLPYIGWIIVIVAGMLIAHWLRPW
jgi:hypothetical protein